MPFKRFDLASHLFLCMIGLALVLTSCQPVHHPMEPIITYTPPAHILKQLPSAFPLLSREERNQEWGKELLMGDQFARELDLYRAITCYKRALFVIPEDLIERQLQIHYNILVCYYLGHKYQDAANTFEESDLIEVNPLFPAYSNLLLILYDTYQRLKQEEKAEAVFEIIQKCSPETAADLSLYSSVRGARLNEAYTQISVHRDREKLQPYWDLYLQNAKSPTRARTLNAILPGAGYYYLGQKKSALTSFLINSLFIATAYQFFQRGYVAAGLITTSLEAGWYLGGINGAGLEAEEFNTRLYECTGQRLLMDQNLFPVLMFETTF